MNHSQRSTCFKVIIHGDFLAKNMIIQHWSYVFLSPPQNPTNLWKRSFQNHWDAFGLNTFQSFFFFSPVLLENNLKKNDSRLETIFVRHEIYFQTYFWAFFENE